MKHGTRDATRRPGPSPAPLIADQPGGTTKVSSPPAPAALRVLLLEDSEMDAVLIRHMLCIPERDVRVTNVATREAFEAALSHQPPQVILSDYSLPGFNGAKALEIAKRITPLVPFIFVTGTLGEEVAIDMLKQGATDYVLKSRLTRLVPAVSRALAEAEHRHERAQAEEKLRRSRDQLRALTGHLQSVREEERTRIAREVHDELGQALTGLKLDLTWLAGKLGATRGLQRKIKTMSGQIDATILAVRRIATEMRPGVLDNLGLAAAIEWQGSDFQAHTTIRCKVTINTAEFMPDREVSTACFRVFQETLTNVIRHAKATRVEAHLAQEDQSLVLTVRDNGRGITEKEIAHPRSIGLIGMKERAAQVGGEISFVGQPAGGTTVTLRLPLHPKAAIASDQS
ncbi:MAG: response regulator [Opitutaceae bacterium]|nr:response regulator [Opitutaceae bacterium]